VNRSQPVLIVLLLIVLFVLGGSIYTVTEVDQAIITQFGEPVGEPVTEPGLHFKLPFIQTANMFERRFLEWDGFRNQVPTRDRRFIWVDTYARWHITDPLLFFQRLRDERGAQSRLDDILDGETRNAVARHDLIEIVRTSNREPLDTATTGLEEAEVLVPISIGRKEITEEILAAAAAAVGDLGIELLDLQFKRITTWRKSSRTCSPA
jgi:membrane protease subunit HflC